MIGGPDLSGESKSHCLSSTEEIAPGLWLAEFSTSESYLLAGRACCQMRLRTVILGFGESRRIPQSSSFQRMNCWTESERAETCRQSTWIPQFSTTNAELSPPTIRHLMIACVLTLGMQMKRAVKHMGTCMASRLKHSVPSTVASSTQRREAYQVEPANPWPASPQPKYNPNPYTRKHKRLQLVSLYLSGARDQTWCPEYAGKSLASQIPHSTLMRNYTTLFLHRPVWTLQLQNYQELKLITNDLASNLHAET
jgi:hypothetical protein